MKILWLIIGIIYLVLAIPYFYLAYKARQKVSLKDIQIDRLPVEPFMPKGNTGLEVHTEIGAKGVRSEIRSQVFRPIIDHANYIADSVQTHLNQFIFPRVKEYLDDTSRINTRGFIVAGVLSVIAAIIAFLIAFLVL
jgi:hypothetical protein